jgi:hypothetical protein
MKVSKSLVVGTLLSGTLALAAGGAALATQTSSTTPKTHEEIGTISSMTNSDLVLSHLVKGKQEDTTFKMDSNTKKEGTIDKGARVAVYFKDENHQRIATDIKAEPKKS